MYIYNFLKTDKKKERFDIILEPLQSITQLALMAFCPCGSKLTISNNLLFIQCATWGQGMIRSFNNDKRDDLFYLFNSIIRFNKFYSYLKDEDNINETDKLLYDILIRLSKKGIDNILQTYSNIDEPSLLHTLQMYKTLLDNPRLIIDTDNKSSQIDDIFIEIREIYSIYDRNIIYNILVLIEERPDYYEKYITGLNNIMECKNIQIKKWITDHIVY